MAATVEKFIERLGAKAPVLVIGGLAVIAHGLTRATQDVDVWLQPGEDASAWASILSATLSLFKGTSAYDLRDHIALRADQIASVVQRDGVIRVAGLDRPLDIFRIPNNMDAADFAEAQERAELKLGTVWVVDELDLLITKEGTMRPQDLADVAFLESKLRSKLSRQLLDCSAEKAARIFQRYADHETCKAALNNPDSNVKGLALRTLQEFAQAGDPFAVEILKEQQAKGKI